MNEIHDINRNSVSLIGVRRVAVGVEGLEAVKILSVLDQIRVGVGDGVGRKQCDESPRRRAFGAPFETVASLETYIVPGDQQGGEGERSCGQSCRRGRRRNLRSGNRAQIGVAGGTGSVCGVEAVVVNGGVGDGVVRVGRDVSREYSQHGPDKVRAGAAFDNVVVLVTRVGPEEDY